MSKDKKILCGFILLWTIINLVQAGFTELAHDEAYYWTWSLFPDWGFIEHPPLVAFFIKMGSALFGGELGVRLITILSSSLVLYLVYTQLVKRDIWLYIGIVSSMFLLHIGSFLTAPDSPLFLFTALFFIVFLKYLERDDWKLALILMVLVAAMMYSKYHAILAIGFAVLANLHLLKRQSFWVLTIGGICLYLPHLVWLLTSGGSGMEYALGDRFDNSWSILEVANYVGGQLGATGPFIGVILLFAAFKGKTQKAGHGTLKFVMCGIFGFFLIWSFRGQIQGNWTATAIIPLIVLGHAYIADKQRLRKWVLYLAVPSVVLMLGLRIQLAHDYMPLPKHVTRVQEFHGWPEYAEEVTALADGKHVMATNYQNASKLWFYTGNTTVAINSNDRPNQFNVWNIEQDWVGEEVLLLHAYLLGEHSEITGPDGTTKQIVHPDFYSLKDARVEIIPERTEFTDQERAALVVQVTPPKDGMIPGKSSSVPIYLSFTITRKSDGDVVRWDSFRVYFDEDISRAITLECPVHMHFGPGEYEVFAWICHEGILSWRQSNTIEITISE